MAFGCSIPTIRSAQKPRISLFIFGAMGEPYPHFYSQSGTVYEADNSEGVASGFAGKTV
jgi:hypothetical protein